MSGTVFRQVEYLRAWNDGTWDTEIYDVPNGTSSEDMIPELIKLVNQNCILIAVYSENPTEGKD